MDLVDPPESPWIDGTIAVAKSPTSGNGLFATKNIERGQVIMRLGGQLVATDELVELLRESPEYVDTLTVYEDVHLVLPAGTSLHFGNHSCDPNLWHVGPYEIAARRQIGHGEELTIDYGTQSGVPGFSMVCACGSDICRGLVTSDDWRLENLQTTYAGHWVPALEERIRNQG